MKSKILLLLALGILTVIGYGVKQSMNDISSVLNELTLQNIEALANLEDGCDICHLGNYGSEPKTVSCKLELGGGWFTGSVARVCITTADTSMTCTPVECGGYY